MINKATNPLLIFGSRHGTMYNLTPTNLPPQIPALQLCYGDFHDHIQTLKNLPQGMSIKKFMGYKDETLTYLTPYDHSKSDCLNGCQNNSRVKIKCNKGYTQITAQQYDNMVDLIKPNIVVGLTQYPSLEKGHDSVSNKSYKRAICKTKSYLQKSKYIKENQQQMEEEKQVPFRLAAVHGGQNLSLISRSLEQVLDHKVDGIIVCDLCQWQSVQERQKIFNTINQRLKQQYEREGTIHKELKLALAGKGKIADIQHAMKFGYEIFEVSYPFLLAESQKALILKDGSYIEYSPLKRQDLLPLDSNCECYTCKNHAQSYIYHLIECYQMTGKVLLSIHNVHMYTKWIQKNCK